MPDPRRVETDDDGGIIRRKRSDAGGHSRSGAAAVKVFDAVGKCICASKCAGRCVLDVGIGVDDRAMAWLRHADDNEIRGCRLDIGVVRTNIYINGTCRGDLQHILEGDRQVVDRVDGDRNGGDIRERAAGAGNGVLQRIAAAVILVRRVGDRAIGVDPGDAVRRGGDDCHGRRIGIAAADVVCNHVDLNRGVLESCGGVVNRHRRRGGAAGRDDED